MSRDMSKSVGMVGVGLLLVMIGAVVSPLVALLGVVWACLGGIGVGVASLKAIARKL
jgi:hypothetical protein